MRIVMRPSSEPLLGIVRGIVKVARRAIVEWAQACRRYLLRRARTKTCSTIVGCER